MRQLGVRVPEPPSVETDAETSPEILPHEQYPVEVREPVEVHRIELNPVEAEPSTGPQETEAAQTLSPAAEPPILREDEGARDPAVPPDRWEELRAHEPDPEEVREPIQVYRVYPNPVVAEPVVRPQQKMKAAEAYSEAPSEASSSVAAPQAAKQEKTAKEEEAKEVEKEEAKEAAAPVGRWEEFHEPRQFELERSDRIHMEPVQQGFSSRLLTADLEREPRSSFLTFAVTVLAAVLIAVALFWSGWLRTRVRQQEAAMSALQEQNRKLADSLAQMSVKQNADGAVAPQNGATAQQPKTMQGEHLTQSGHSGLPARGSDLSEKRQGVSVPPSQSPVQGRARLSTPQKGSLYERPPEIIPPYPTLARPENTGANTAVSQPAPNAGAYRQPFTPGASQQPVPVTGSSRPTASAPTTSVGTPSRPGVPAPAAPRLPTSSATNNSSTPASSSYNATKYDDAGIGSYANLLAQNVEAVEGLQRHSAVQLREFHARAGVPTQATRTVRLSVQHPDQSSGSYGVVVDEEGSSYQLRGEVNRPLVFTDSATHRQYGLVVLSIAGSQVYGYLQATQ